MAVVLATRRARGCLVRMRITVREYGDKTGCSYRPSLAPFLHSPLSPAEVSATTSPTSPTSHTSHASYTSRNDIKTCRISRVPTSVVYPSVHFAIKESKLNFRYWSRLIDSHRRRIKTVMMWIQIKRLPCLRLLGFSDCSYGVSLLDK